MNQAARERPSPLALSKNSHMIAKLKPKIRIVHIFAPEIIKTDVENFRELVQRLTGKPAKRIGGKKAPAAAIGAADLSGDLLREERVKEELMEETSSSSELWKEDTNRGGFFSGLGDVEGLFEDFGNHFPLLPMDSAFR